MRTAHNGRTYEWTEPLAPDTVITVNGALHVDFATISRNRDLSSALQDYAFNPRQMRVPKGNDSGGQWIDSPGGLADGLSGNSVGDTDSASGGSSGGEPGYKSPLLDSVAKNKDKPGRLEGKGTPDDPIYVGEDLDKAMDLLGEGKYVRIDSSDDDLKVITDMMAEQSKGSAMDICKVSIDQNLFCSGSAGRPRVTMPQFATKNPLPGSEAEKHMVNGEADMSPEFKQDLTSRGVKISTDKRPAANYLPAQSEMLASKSAGIAKALRAGKTMPGTVFVSRDGYVIDGHHRWAAVNINTGLGEGDGMMDVEIVDMDITDVLHYANQWTEDQGMPHADILGKPVSSDAAKAADKRRAELIAFSVAQIMTYGGNPGQARVPRGNGIRSGRWVHVVGAVIAGLGSALSGMRPMPGDEDEPDAGNALVEHVGRDTARDALDAATSEKKKKTMRGSAVSRDRMTPEGRFTDEAIADQDATIESTFQGVAPTPEGEQKVVYFNIGGPGSGKGGNTGVNREVIGWPKTREVDDMTGEPDFAGTPNPEAALLDADSWKIQHPVVKTMRGEQQAHGNMNDTWAEGGNWADQSHEESSYMNKLAYTRALEKGLPIVFDGTGDGGIESVREKVEEARKHGYIVKAGGVYLEPTEGLKRATSRASKTGRNVPPKMQADTYVDIVDTYNQAEKEGLFDSVVWLDNNGVQKGQTAKPIYEYTASGGINILDQAAWDRFQSSKDRLPTTGEFA